MIKLTRFFKDAILAVAFLLGGLTVFFATRADLQWDRWKDQRTHDLWQQEMRLMDMERDVFHSSVDKTIAHLVDIDPDVLNAYACDYVNARIPKGNPDGCYDYCFELGEGKYDAKLGVIKEPLDLSQVQNGALSHELQNACAIVMHGGEY